MGLWSRLGTFATKIWDWARSQASPVTSAAEMAGLADVTVEPAELWREYRKAIRLEGTAESIAGTDPHGYIARGLYTESDIPWNRPYAYEVTISGRDLSTGRFTRTGRWITTSKELTPAEIMDEAIASFGRGGGSEQIDVSHISVTGAQYRAGEAF